MTAHRVHKTHLCSKCHQPGHNARTCKAELPAVTVDALVAATDPLADLSVTVQTETDEVMEETHAMMMAGF